MSEEEVKEKPNRNKRTFFIEDLDTVDVESYEGQKLILKKIQVALATQELTASDFKAISMLKETVFFASSMLGVGMPTKLM